MGSPSDPVTTNPNMGEIAVTVRHPMDKSTAAITRRPRGCDFAQYLSGYVDGEGCFTVSVSKRIKMRTGWEIRPSFSVSQNFDRAQVLYLIREYFECGTIRPDRSDKTLKYEVRSLQELVTKIIPHFERYPMLSEEQASFLAFREICFEMTSGRHLSPNSLNSILIRAEKINQGKRKHNFEKI